MVSKPVGVGHETDRTHVNRGIVVICINQIFKFFENVGKARAFILCQKTAFMDRNYSYAYTRRRIKNTAQEEAAIKNATMKDEDLLNGVLTKYVMEGMRKTGVWQDAVERKLFLNVIKKYKEIMDYCKRF